MLNNSRKIHIYTANSRNSTRWNNHETTWSAFVGRLKEPLRSTETLAEYFKLPKERQTELKDAGGFVGGQFAGSNREKSGILGRDLITLDLDRIQPGEVNLILRKIEKAGIAACVYSTRSHRASNPRLRSVFPLKETIAPDMYEPLSRWLAQKIGIIGNCDPTTFQVTRLMFNPSCCSDSEYVFRVFDKPMFDGMAVLSSFDWKDVSKWPKTSDEHAFHMKAAKAQQDPTTKEGIVGIFCRTYNIDDAIEHFLKGIYVKCGENRYTYVAGSTTGGAVVYEDGKFLYSHHATDPCRDKLVNSFDLVRIHLYGKFDSQDEVDTPDKKSASWNAFAKALTFDEKIQASLLEERSNKTLEAFPDIEEQKWKPTPSEWESLDRDGRNNKLKATIFNFQYILEHDPRLKGKIANDVFSNSMVAKNGMFWDKGIQKTRNWDDKDDAQLALYFEHTYSIRNETNMLKALAVTAANNQFNPVEEYLKSLVWDGTPRIDDLLHTYLGAERNAYTRDVMRASLTGAIGRAIIGGTKWDYTPILVGAQGLGKSTFLQMLGKDWFSDSLQSFDGKDASELIQGVWINELPELAAFSKGEVNKIKQFLTKTHDLYRPAYARRVEKRPRRCVFFGSTNDDEFLRDATGDRRYWPIDLDPEKAELPISAFTSDVVDQIWAEAYQLWKNKEVEPFLVGEAAELALKAQESHKLADDWDGIIRRYLEMSVPSDWQTRALKDRRLIIDGVFNGESDSKINQICINEIWCEAFGKNSVDLDQFGRRRIASIMRNLKDWEPVKGLSTSYSGRQKGYRRKNAREAN